MGHFLYNLIWTWTPNFSSFWSFSCSLWTAFTLLLWFKNILKILKNLHLQNEIPPNPKHDEKRGHERLSGHCLVQGWSSCNHTATSPGINPEHKNIISPLCSVLFSALARRRYGEEGITTVGSNPSPLDQCQTWGLRKRNLQWTISVNSACEKHPEAVHKSLTKK